MRGERALLERNWELKSRGRRVELKDERPWPLRSCLFIPALTARLIARQPALHDAAKHLDHFLFHRLPRNLQQERLGKNSILDALLSQRLGNIAQRQSLGHRGARPANLPGDILMRIFKLRA